MEWPQLIGVNGVFSPVDTQVIIRSQHESLDMALLDQEKQAALSAVLGQEALQAGGVAVEYTEQHEPKT